MNYETHVESEIRRAVKLVRKDHCQRWVTMDGAIHAVPVPYRDAVSVCWLPICDTVVYNYRSRVLAHPAG